MADMTHLEDLEEHHSLGGGLRLKHGPGDGQYLVPILQFPTGADYIEYFFLKLSVEEWNRKRLLSEMCQYLIIKNTPTIPLYCCWTCASYQITGSFDVIKLASIAIK